MSSGGGGSSARTAMFFGRSLLSRCRSPVTRLLASSSLVARRSSLARELAMKTSSISLFCAADVAADAADVAVARRTTNEQSFIFEKIILVAVAAAAAVHNKVEHFAFSRTKILAHERARAWPSCDNVVVVVMLDARQRRRCTAGAQLSRGCRRARTLRPHARARSCTQMEPSSEPVCLQQIAPVGRRQCQRAAASAC